MKKRFFKDLFGYIKISPKLFLYQVAIEAAKRNIKLGINIESTVKKKDRFICELLTKRYINLINDFNKYENNKDKLEDSKPVPKIIWFMWWQGLNNAPEIVKYCISEMKKNNPDWKVNIIDKDNYRQYVDIDEAIIKNLSKGKIRIQHFSDLVRFKLLYNYGGVWADGTLFSLKSFPDEIRYFDYFTAKRIEDFESSKYWIEITDWVSYFLVSKKNNLTIKWILIILNDFLVKGKVFPDYLLINYIAKIGRENILILKKEFDRIPNNNFYIETGKYYLLKNQFSKVQESETMVIKLNHRTEELFLKLKNLDYMKDEEELW